MVLGMMGPLVAQMDAPLTIEADTIVYDRSEHLLTASDNVQVFYDDNQVFGDAFQFDYENELLWFPKTMTISQQNSRVQVTNLSYSMKTYEGAADSIEGKLDRLIIKGGAIAFTPEFITIASPSFTTCDLPDNKHYYLESRKMILYPQWGFMVAFDNTLHTPVLPFPFWVPTYIYGSKRYSLLASASPIPDVGSNAREGGYVKQKIAYFFDNRSNGTLDLGYTQNQTWYFGFNHGQLLTENQALNLRWHYLGYDGTEGALVYSINLNTVPTTGKKNLFGSLFSSLNEDAFRLSRLSLQAIYRELNNDSRVSYWPQAQLDLNRVELGNSEIFWTNTFLVGQLQEETPQRAIIRSSRKGSDTNFHKQLFKDATWGATADLNYYGYWYDASDWQRLFGRVGFDWYWPVLNPRVSYSKRLGLGGMSPFEFENKYAQVGDEIGFGVSHDFGTIGVFSEGDYSLDDKVFRNFDVGVKLTDHCWRTIVRWKMQQAQFQFGVELF